MFSMHAMLQDPRAGGAQIWSYDAGQIVAPSLEETTVSSPDVGSILAPRIWYQNEDLIPDRIWPPDFRLESVLAQAASMAASSVL